MKSLKYLLLLIFISSCQSSNKSEGLSHSLGRGHLNEGVAEFKGLKRTFYLYKPQTDRQKLKEKPRALVLMLHGCLQTAHEFMESTQMNELADRENFLVLYPQQTRIQLKKPEQQQPEFDPNEGHPAACWNWYESENQKRDSGESGLIAKLIRDTAEKYEINSKHIYAAGISAGAGMASILGSCYPDRVSALSLHAGPLFGSAQNLTEATKVMGHPKDVDPYKTAIQAYECSKPQVEKQSYPLSVQIWHGTKDRVVSVSHAFLQARHFRHFNDFFKGNQISQSTEPFATKAVNSDSILVYSWQRYIFRDSPIEIMLVSQLGHAWSGGSNKKWNYFGDPKGPNASQETWRFFQESNRH